MRASGRGFDFCSINLPVDTSPNVGRLRYTEEGINPFPIPAARATSSGHALPRLGKGGAYNKHSWQLVRLPY